MRHAGFSRVYGVRSCYLQLSYTITSSIRKLCSCRFVSQKRITHLPLHPESLKETQQVFSKAHLYQLARASSSRRASSILTEVPSGGVPWKAGGGEA